MARRKKSDAEKIVSTVQKTAKKHGLRMRTKVILFILLTLVLGVSLLFNDTINNFLGLGTPKDVIVSANSTNTLEELDGGELVVHFVDVGQGDCTIIELPDGKTMIIDAGYGTKSINEDILLYIKTYLPSDFQVFDYAILTHTDKDHCGGFKTVLTQYPARTIYRPNTVSTRNGFDDPCLAITNDSSISDANLKFWQLETDNPTTEGLDTKDTLVYKDFVETAYKPFLLNGETITPTVIVSDARPVAKRPASKALQDIQGVDSKGNPYEIRFYNPLSDNYTDFNDCSSVFVIDYMDIQVLLTGDAETRAENEMVEEFQSIKDEIFGVEAIKLGHHGSRTSSQEAFLEMVTNQAQRSEIFTLISCGFDNKYKHPHQSTLDRVGAMGFDYNNLYRTDLHGDVIFSYMLVGDQMELLAGSQNTPNIDDVKIGGDNESGIVTPKYTISFNTNGGSSVNSIVQEYDSVVTKPTDPTKTGYKFIGWYSDEALTQGYTFDKMPKGNITLYAKWEQTKEFYIEWYMIAGVIEVIGTIAIFSTKTKKNY